jgi:hypothetical protein
MDNNKDKDKTTMDTNNSSWYKLLMDDKNFSMDTPYSFEFLMKSIKEVNEDIENIKPFQFLVVLFDITKAFRMLSSALSVAFSDITSKVGIWRDLFKNNYKDSKSMQEVMQKEIDLKLCELNGDNNKSLGHKKKTEYYSYTSGRNSQ